MDFLATPAVAEPAPEPVFLPRRVQFVVGVDLGQSASATAVSVVEMTEGVLDFNSELERHTGSGTIAQKPQVRWAVRHLERYPIGLDYPTMVGRIQELMSRPPLAGDQFNARADLVVDNSGVGRAVTDIMVVHFGLRPICVTITSSLDDDDVWVGDDRWHVSKSKLIHGLIGALQHPDAPLKFAAGLAAAAAMKDELAEFQRKVSASGRESWSGENDDLILATALALWWAQRSRPRPAAYGRSSMFARQRNKGRVTK